MNLFSFNQYLFSDRTKLNLERGLSFYGNPFLFYKPTHQQKEKAGFKQKKDQPDEAPIDLF